MTTLTRNTAETEIIETVEAQRRYFHEDRTLSIQFRKDMLRRLLDALDRHERQLCGALEINLSKSYQEAWITEISVVRSEILSHIRHLRKWTRATYVSSPAALPGSSSRMVTEPLGCTLIMAPWNYPVQLLLCPLVGAISSGCTAILKPSPYVPDVSAAMADMISETFPREYIAVIQGNRDVNTMLLRQRFDLIFFTGSPALAKVVAVAAAVNLTPMVLELGGKSPCIISGTADIPTAARRIAWGKTVNAGQTCIAPDYVIIQRSVREKFVKCFAESIRVLHGDDIRRSAHYARMVSDSAFARVASYISQGKILYGGRTDKTERFIEPTLVECSLRDAPILNQEIFGPVLPMIVIDSTDDAFEDKAVELIRSGEKPLALYYFGKRRNGWKVIRRASSGGACINDTMVHFANPKLPFGGVGNSGMGRYHGRYSIEAFSHRRAVVSSPTWPDLPFRYMPYRWFAAVRRILGR